MEQTRRQVTRVNLRVCANGHAEPIPGTEQDAWQIRCRVCQDWTWEEGNYCVNCGHRLAATPPAE